MIKRVDIQKASWSDERGWGVEPLKAAGLSPENLGNLHVVSMAPGSVRGNHLHPKSTEWIQVLGGPVEIAWRSGEAGERHSSIVEGDRTVLFEIPPGVSHALRNNSRETIFLCCFADAGERDTVHIPPLF